MGSAMLPGAGMMTVRYDIGCIKRRRARHQDTSNLAVTKKRRWLKSKISARWPRAFKALASLCGDDRARQPCRFAPLLR